MKKLFVTYIAIIFWLFSACAAKRQIVEVETVGQIGEEVSLDKAISNEQGDFIYYDRYTQRVHTVNSLNGTLQSSSSLASEFDLSNVALLAGSSPEQFFVIESDSLYVMTAERTIEKIHVFASPINSYASDYRNGNFAFVDEFGGVLLASYPQGKPATKWVGSSLLTADESFTIGDIIGDKLVLATNIDRLIVIDIKESINSQSWIYEELSQAVKITWFGKARANAAFALYVDADQNLGVINITQGQITSLIDLSGHELLYSKDGIDHVIARNLETSEILVYTLSQNGSLITGIAPETNIDVESTTVNGDYLLASSGNRQQTTFYKIRLSDGLIESRVDAEDYDRIAYTEDKVVLFKDSPLGFVEIINFADREVKSIAGFNLEALQK